MPTMVCNACGWQYDPAAGDSGSGVAPGTAFGNIPDDWVCPECGAGKDEFSPADQARPQRTGSAGLGCASW